MGTWGLGNFDNDGALDYVNEQIDSLVQRITDILADDDRARLDEEGEAVLMPSVAMISLLIEECHGVPRSDLPVSVWQARYLALYDAQIAELAPDGAYTLARRQVIAATFARLAEQMRRLWPEIGGKDEGGS